MGTNISTINPNQPQLCKPDTFSILKQIVQQQLDKIKKKKLKIATINIIDIDSPYFIRPLPQCIEQLNNKIISIKKSKYHFLVPDINSSSVVYMNQKVVKGRYSPFYKLNAGINLDNMTLMNRAQFQQQWQIEIKTALDYYKIFFQSFDDQFKLESMLNTLKNYDFMCYHGIIAYVYNGSKGDNNQSSVSGQEDNVLNIINNNTAAKYKSFQCLIFQNRILENEYRAIKLVEGFEKRNYDIICLQNAEEDFIAEINKFSEGYRFGIPPSNKSTNKQLGTKKSFILIKKQLTYELGLTQYEKSLPLQFHNRFYVKFKKDENIISKSDDEGQKQANEFQKHKKAQISSILYKNRQPKNRKLAPINSKPKEKTYSNIQKNTTVKSSGLKRAQTQEPSLNSPFKQITSVFGIPIPQEAKQPSAQRQSYEDWKIQAMNNSLRSTDSKLAPTLYSLKRKQSRSKAYSELQNIESRSDLKLTDIQIDSLTWNDRTFIQFFGEMIIISTCLYAQDIQYQLKRIKASLDMLQEKYRGYTIIVGVSIQKLFSLYCINPYLVQSIFTTQYVYPKLHAQTNRKTESNADISQQIQAKKIHTTNKRYMRSFLSLESIHNKSNIQDYLITNKQMSNCGIINLAGSLTQNISDSQSLPNSRHPFLHYIVEADIEVSIFDRSELTKIIKSDEYQFDDFS